MNLRKRFSQKLEDKELRRKMALAMSTSLAHRQERLTEVPEWEELREAAHSIRQYTLAHLSSLLHQAEAQLQARGVNVFWAEDAQAANNYIIALAQRLRATQILKGKTMTSEETRLNEALRRAGVEPIETDLGEYLIQLCGDPPTHMTAPAVHLSRQDCGRLLCEHLGHPYTEDPRELTLLVRAALRPQFLQAQLGLSGANFLVAETGTIVICDNEGNQGLVTALSDVHVALVGIDKIVPRLQDLGPLLRLLARNSTGQTLTTYTTLINGPRDANDLDGPRELHVIFLDNGRTRMLNDPIARNGLACIRCGVCCNICPIYSKVGGHPYWIYPGAIGSIWAPFVAQEAWTAELPHVCTLCGACSDVCPVKNRLHRALLLLRQRPTSRHSSPWLMKTGTHLLSWIFSYPRLYAFAGRLLRFLWPGRRIWGLLPPVAHWNQSRELPSLPPKTFQQMWQQQKISSNKQAQNGYDTKSAHTPL